MDGAGISRGEVMKAACPLEGGAVSSGSTCGVVSGGCLATALAHRADLASGDPGKIAAVYGELQDYTRWFDQEFGSTLCRDRTGVPLTTLPGLANYLFTGKFVTRCIDHARQAAGRLVDQVSLPLDAVDTAVAEGLECGYCAAPVMRRVREETVSGAESLETISVALDGGIGLAGGLCGALAAALMRVGEVWGFDPSATGVLGTLRPFFQGHINMYGRRERGELWSVGGRLVHGFRKEFGSSECRDLVGRSFGDVSELASYLAGSEKCERIKEWCGAEATRLIREYQ